MALRNAFDLLGTEGTLASILAKLASRVLNNGDVVQPITTISGYFQDEFGGTALDASKWDVLTNTGGMTYSVSGSILTVNMNTTSGALLMMVSKENFTLPTDLNFSFAMTQRIANNFFDIGFVECNPTTGALIDNPNLAGDFANRVFARFNGTVTTTANVGVVAQLAGNESQASAGSFNSTTTQSDFSMETRENEIYLWQVNTNSASGKSFSPVRMSSQIPDLNKTYKMVMRFANSGGAPASNTQVQIQALRVVDMQEIPVEITSSRGQNNAAVALPILPVGTGQIASAFQSSQDQASAVITATTTGSTITPSYPGGGVEFQIAVTAVSGTAPTLDMGIEESDDAGISWYRIYDFPRITAVGVYRTPIMPQNGSRIRYVYTVTGTTPSFTRSVYRNQQVGNWPSRYRQFVSRALVPTTLNSATAAYEVGNCDTIDAFIWTTTVGATPAQYALQGSDDGVNWFDMSTTVTASATGATRLTSRDTIFRFIRVIAKVAGVGTVTDYIIMKAWR